MGYDAISNARAFAFGKDSARKKGRRLEKLKQDKVDFRREQWLSQVKNKGNKSGTNGSIRTLPPAIPKGVKELQTHGNAGGDQQEITSGFDVDAVSWMTSTNLVHISCGKDSSGSRSSGSGSCSSSCSEGERDDILDNWEAMADALTAARDKQASDVKQRSEPEQFAIDDRSKSCNKTSQAAVLNTVSIGRVYSSHKNGRAWSADDVFRPGSLPILSKQTSEYGLFGGPTMLVRKRVVSEQRHPLSCPICCEDLDLTDSNFLPCPCGFQLCLFCHKRILEVDARCPGCRKQYDSAAKGFGGKPLNSSL